MGWGFVWLLVGAGILVLNIACQKKRAGTTAEEKARSDAKADYDLQQW